MNFKLHNFSPSICDIRSLFITSLRTQHCLETFHKKSTYLTQNSHIRVSQFKSNQSKVHEDIQTKKKRLLIKTATFHLSI